MRYTATYSPEDNKLRLYASTRLDTETYTKLKAAGFSWAPKQELFFAPAWSPGREDLLIELAGEIEAEDSDRESRAEARAERFETYSEKRGKEANAARDHADQISECFYGGQPILVGHHSEKRARKDQERIHDNMRKAVKLWDTSEYWLQRAASSLAHAEYLDKPAVRARRIKKLEAEQRKVKRDHDKSKAFISAWGKAITLDPVGQLKAALAISNVDWSYQAAGWSELKDGKATPEEVALQRIASHERFITRAARWIQHYDNRLVYEKAMLNQQGASKLIEPKARPTQLPLLNYRAAGGTIEAASRYERNRMQTYTQVDMTKAEFAAIGTDYKGTLTIDGTHRIRSAMVRKPGIGHMSLHAIFITDSKTHEIPEKAAPKAATEPRPRPIEVRAPIAARPAAKPEAAEFEALRQQLKAGVQIVVAPQLFPTPPAIAAKMIEAAAIEAGMRILEPSAGTGNLIKAMPNIRPAGTVTAVEINAELARILEPLADRVITGDFLELAVDPVYDRIIMNPPFERAADIKHIKHALQFLAPGGRLVALCAAGPRQEAELKSLAIGAGGSWEKLPAGSFAAQGTNVNVAMLTITVPARRPAVLAQHELWEI